MIFAFRKVASLTIEYRIFGTHTHTHRRMHPCMHARTHAHMHTNTQSSCGRWHAQRAANLLCINNFKVFPYRIPQRYRFTSARHTIIETLEHHVRADYITNGTVTIEYSNIVLFISALKYMHRHCVFMQPRSMCKP